MEVGQYSLKTGNIRYISVKFPVTSGDFWLPFGKSGRMFWTCPKHGMDSARMTTPFEVYYVSVLSILSINHLLLIVPPLVSGGGYLSGCLCPLCPLHRVCEFGILVICHYLSGLHPLYVHYSSVICPWRCVVALLQSDTFHLIWPPDVSGLDYFISGAFRFQFQWHVTQPLCIHAAVVKHCFLHLEDIGLPTILHSCCCHCCHGCCHCSLAIYILSLSEIISGWVLTCDFMPPDWNNPSTRP